MENDLAVVEQKGVKFYDDELVASGVRRTVSQVWHYELQAATGRAVPGGDGVDHGVAPESGGRHAFSRLLRRAAQRRKEIHRENCIYTSMHDRPNFGYTFWGRAAARPILLTDFHKRR